MRNVPAALLQHLKEPARTVCLLLDITLATGETYGLTNLNRDVEFGGTVYSAKNGFDASVIASDLGLSVDNGAIYALFTADIPGITPELVANGGLDGATWNMRLINYLDPSMGSVLLDSGDVGEVEVEDGVVYIPELVSLAMRLRQSVGSVWSTSCRAVFGSPAGGQYGCGVDASGLWRAGTVTGVDAENSTYSFAVSVSVGDLTSARIQFISGMNASAKHWQVEAIDGATNALILSDDTPFPIAVGDQIQIRVDCLKSAENCKAFNNFINFKGEPLIPLNGSTVMTPLANNLI